MTTSKATSSTTSNEHQDTSNQLEVEKPLKTTDSVESFEVNSDFDKMVDESTKTKEQSKQDEQGQKQSTPSNLTYSPKAAADIALKGLYGALGLTSRFSGFEIQLTKEIQTVFAAMATPLIMKHGKTIEGLLNPANVDLNSNVPEYLAAASVAVVAVPTYLQIKQVNLLKKEAAKQQESLSTANQKAKETGEPQAVETHGD